MSEKEKNAAEYRGVRDEIRQQQLKTRDMTLKGKLKYFWDYYKIHTHNFLCPNLHIRQRRRTGFHWKSVKNETYRRKKQNPLP